MDTTGVFLHQLSLMPGHGSTCEQALLSICFCVWTKYEGYNLQGTQSCGREGNLKKMSGNIYCFDFSEKLSPLPISGESYYTVLSSGNCQPPLPFTPKVR